MAKGNDNRILNCIPSTFTEKDWTFDDALASGALQENPEKIPETVDLRDDWWKVGDQGSTGSCVGWATVDSVIRWHLVKAGLISKEAKLSIRFIWMAAKETDEYISAPTTFIEIAGTSLKSALDIARKYGNVLDKVLPFEMGTLYQGRTETFYSLASKLKIQSYHNLGIDANNWRKWLANNGPILTRLDVDATWDKANAANSVLAEYQSNTARGGHAVAIVGYKKDCFIVRNSWGETNWGDRGFAYALDGYAVKAFTEAYGISV